MNEDRQNAKVSYIRKLEAENARLRSQAYFTPLLISTAEALMAAAPAFRLKKIGFEGSQARLQQDAHIEAEDAAKAVIEEAKKSLT